MQKILWLHNKLLPIKFYTKGVAKDLLKAQYQRQWDGVTLLHLAQIVSDSAWALYQTSGWLSFHLNLDDTEKRMLEAHDRLSLAELGVVPGRAEIHSNAVGRAGYDATYGWLRTPAFSFNQYYLATHPRMYATMVGLYARGNVSRGNDSTSNE